jgi:hypothetical protein
MKYQQYNACLFLISNFYNNRLLTTWQATKGDLIRKKNSFVLSYSQNKNNRHMKFY